ncbi:hypothetical protein ACFLYQ_07070 [Chloroflexota bacterium]
MAIDGTYEVEMTTTMGTEKISFTLETSGASLSGSMEGFFGKQEFDGGIVNGNKASWTVAAQGPMGEMDLEIEATVTDDEIAGQVKLGNFRPSEFKGKRV